MEKSRVSKKLSLTRETLRLLQEEHLQAVLGGLTRYSCANSCDPDSVIVCPHTTAC